MNHNIAEILKGVVDRLRDLDAPLLERDQLATDIRPLLSDYDQRVTQEMRRRADEAFRWRRDNGL